MRQCVRARGQSFRTMLRNGAKHGLVLNKYCIYSIWVSRTDPTQGKVTWARGQSFRTMLYNGSENGLVLNQNGIYSIQVSRRDSLYCAQFPTVLKISTVRNSLLCPTFLGTVGILRTVETFDLGTVGILRTVGILEKVELKTNCSSPRNFDRFECHFLSLFLALYF